MLDAMQAALPLAESLLGKIEALEAWGAEQSCNAEILRLKLESIESGDAEISIRAQAHDAISQQSMRAADAESKLIHARMRWDHYLGEATYLESQLAERNAEIARLREALERIKPVIRKARNRASAALTAYDIASDILAALAPIPEDARVKEEG